MEVKWPETATVRLGPIVFWPFCPLLRGCPLSEVKSVLRKVSIWYILCSEVISILSLIRSVHSTVAGIILVLDIQWNPPIKDTLGQAISSTTERLSSSWRSKNAMANYETL